jgi:hypothetical protein
MFWQISPYTLNYGQNNLWRLETRALYHEQDCLGNTVYVFEFKLVGNGTVAETLQQIEGKGYLVPWSASGKRLVKVEAVFDPATRTLGEWRQGD